MLSSSLAKSTSFRIPIEPRIRLLFSWRIPGMTAYAVVFRPLMCILSRSGRISGVREEIGTATRESRERFCTELDTTTAGRLFPHFGRRGVGRSIQITVPLITALLPAAGGLLLQRGCSPSSSSTDSSSFFRRNRHTLCSARAIFERKTKSHGVCFKTSEGFMIHERRG